MVKRFCPEECFSPANWVEYVYFYAIMRSERVQTPFLYLHRFSSLLLQPFTVKKKEREIADRCIFPPAATIAFTPSAERKQSGYCVPLEWPAPILTAPTPPTMTTRGTDTSRCRCCCHRCCCCRCTRASTILWSPRVVVSFVRL